MMTHPTSPLRLAVSGRLARSLVSALSLETSDLRARAVSASHLSPADLEWTDAYAGFSLPDNLGDSHVGWVHSMNAGVDEMLAALQLVPRPVLLTRTVGRMPQKVARYVLAHVLGEVEHIVPYDDQQRSRLWRPLETEVEPGTPVTILGTGALGSAVALAFRAIGSPTSGVSRHGAPNPAFDRVVPSSRARGECQGNRVVISTLPLTLETAGFVSTSLLDGLENAVFVNVGRGATVVLDDLRRALNEDRLRRAILDVFEAEPLPKDSWCWGHPKVTVTPHVAGLTDERDVLEDLLQTYGDIAAGREPGRSVSRSRGY